jgi:hypothetical protein
MPPDETFDVGVDTRTGVDDNDYQVPFRFTVETKASDRGRDAKKMKPEPKPTKRTEKTFPVPSIGSSSI